LKQFIPQAAASKRWLWLGGGAAGCGIHCFKLSSLVVNRFMAAVSRRQTRQTVAYHWLEARIAARRCRDFLKASDQASGRRA